MDLCNNVVLHGKICSVGHYTQTVQPNFFMPIMIMGTIDLNLFILLLLTLALPEGHKVSAKQSLLASFSCTFFV